MSHAIPVAPVAHVVDVLRRDAADADARADANSQNGRTEAALRHQSIAYTLAAAALTVTEAVSAAHAQGQLDQAASDQLADASVDQLIASGAEPFVAAWLHSDTTMRALGPADLDHSVVSRGRTGLLSSITVGPSVRGGESDTATLHVSHSERVRASSQGGPPDYVIPVDLDCDQTVSLILQLARRLQAGDRAIAGRALLGMPGGQS